MKRTLSESSSQTFRRRKSSSASATSSVFTTEDELGARVPKTSSLGKKIVASGKRLVVSVFNAVRRPSERTKTMKRRYTLAGRPVQRTKSSRVRRKANKSLKERRAKSMGNLLSKISIPDPVVETDDEIVCIDNPEAPQSPWIEIIEENKNKWGNAMDAIRVRTTSL